ncbi:MAG: YfhO family protein [Clostridia bacterium]|nr:YfhO family protein [Clostridia bacterium]
MSTRLSPKASRIASATAMSVLFAVLVFLLLWGFGSFNPTGIDTSTAVGMAQKATCCGGIAGLLGMLLYIISHQYLRGSKEKAPAHAVWYYPVMAGLLSLFVMCVAYTFVGMWPFGEKSAMMVDMHHQYAPLLAELRYDILHGADPLYTFEVGLGANYLSLFGYYLASPFNLFLLLFPERLLAQGILCITLLKNALSGALFALCIQQLLGKRGLHIPIVSVMYSMMMYLIAYSWNIMWLDVVMILPLVVYGFERLMHTGKFLTYVLSLAYALFANYYIAFMLCIFLILYYITYCLRSPRTGKQLGTSFVRFGGFSILAAGLTAFLLVPVYIALQGTSAAESTMPDITNTIDMFSLLGRHLVDTSPTVRSGNLPNLYCGVLTAFCVPLFALNKGITPRRRGAFMALWLVLFVTFLINWTDLAWHGFHSPNDLPYRFSFLYSFVILLMAADALVHLHRVETRHVFLVFAGAVAYLMLEEHFGEDAYGFSTIYINLIVFAVYTTILAFATKRKMRRAVAYAVLLLAVTAEMALGGGNSFVKLNSNEYFTRHKDYVDNEVTEAVRDTVRSMQTLGDAQNGKDFYRLEFLPRRTCVDTALFHYRGLTTFSSSNYYTTTRLLGGLGYAINGVNSHLYKSYLPFTDSLLGIRYIALGENETVPAYLQYRDEVTVGDTTYTVYENPSALGLGYVVDAASREYTYTRYDPFHSQNSLFSALTDNYGSLFSTYSIQADNLTTGSVTGSASGFRVHASGSQSTAFFSATIEKTAPIYLYVDCGAADSLTVNANGKEWSITPHEPYIINAGVLEVGSTVTLTVGSDTECSGNFYVAEFAEDIYQTGMAQLAANQLTVEDFGSSRISGTVTASRDGVLMTSIPYDAGWHVAVDGTAVETFGISDGLLALDVTAGTHTVTFTYWPRGLTVGLGVSAVSLIALIVLLIVTRPRKPAPMKEVLDYENAQPIQQGFSVENAEPKDLPPLPETLSELTNDNAPPPPENN